MGNCNSYVDSDYCYGDYHNYGHGTYLNHYCDGHGDGSSSFSVYSPCYGYGYGYPCGGIEYSNDCNLDYDYRGYSSSSGNGDVFRFYDYDNCGDSDDYCGGYGYLNCNSYVDSDYCGRNYYNYGHGTYLNHYCDGHGDSSSSYSVYSPCYGYGYGYPCGGIEVGHGGDGYYGHYGYSSESPCGSGYSLYFDDYCDDSDDYCGGYGYLDCGSQYVYDCYCGYDYHRDCLPPIVYEEYLEGEVSSCGYSVYSPCYGYGYGYPCGGIEYSNDCNLN